MEDHITIQSKELSNLKKFLEKTNKEIIRIEDLEEGSIRVFVKNI